MTATPHPSPGTGVLYETPVKIYPRSVRGRFDRWRRAMVVVTQLVFLGLPWLTWNGRPALLFDLEARRFYVFGWVLWQQDLIYLVGLLVAAALTLFLFTAVAGRLWCGYACPQTVYTEMFLAIERWTEGDRQARMRLDAAPWGMAKFARKAAKHLLWGALALVTGLTFVGYFTPIRELIAELTTGTLGPWETFWIAFYAFATYGNAGWLREQMCKTMCPYARFQSALIDADSLIIAYDHGRGEPRGSRARGANARAQGLGDCVDCTLCVQVCPTGIDIRNGLQNECIGCAACIDACDTVMDKLGYSRGLIRYTTARGLDTGGGWRGMLAHALRWRVVIYGVLLTGVVGTLTVALMLRPGVAVDALRDRGTLASLGPEGVANTYQLLITNRTEQAARYTVTATGLSGARADVAHQPIVLPPAGQSRVAIRLVLPHALAIQTRPGTHTVTFVVQNDRGETATAAATFLVPR
ncbi:cytochrome c oxidase accessory protein CcoG [Tepidimonas taiwanensis]|uniref:cytochrome c oxidase accessory protein CcoG n=1 Tax=Tepidimonas taiwanensis TaxID=307486 RepID=UPI001E5445ED|nr:cytochrome c oxidase accessory protein CcoG [Tepidimonas taiwanensis]